MQIHELKVNNRRDKKRVGRGGKRGTYSGRGMNGQGARSGGKKDPLFEGGRSSLVQRMKKLRGFKSFKPAKNIIDLSELEANFKDGDVVDVEGLIKNKLLRRKFVKNGVKVLANGEISKKLTIDNNILLSGAAKKSD